MPTTRAACGVLAALCLAACAERAVETGAAVLSPPFARRAAEREARGGLPAGLAREAGVVRPALGGTGTDAAHRARAARLLALGGRDEAAAALVDAWRVAPHDDGLARHVALALRDAGYEDASLGVLAGLNATADVHVARAELHWRAARRDAARAELARALDLDPEHGAAQALLARAHFLAGNRAAARTAALHALAAGIDVPATLLDGEAR